MDRLGPLGQMTVRTNLAQRPDDVSLKLEIHGQIGVLPIAKHTQADKFIALHIHLFTGVLPTSPPKIGRFDLHPGLAHFFLNHQFDGQAMAIPTRHIRGIKAG